MGISIRRRTAAWPAQPIPVSRRGVSRGRLCGGSATHFRLGARLRGGARVAIAAGFFLAAVPPARKMAAPGFALTLAAAWPLHVGPGAQRREAGPYLLTPFPRAGWRRWCSPVRRVRCRAGLWGAATRRALPVPPRPSVEPRPTWCGASWRSPRGVPRTHGRTGQLLDLDSGFGGRPRADSWRANASASPTSSLLAFGIIAVGGIVASGAASSPPGWRERS